MSQGCYYWGKSGSKESLGGRFSHSLSPMKDQKHGCEERSRDLPVSYSSPCVNVTFFFSLVNEVQYNSLHPVPERYMIQM